MTKRLGWIMLGFAIFYNGVVTAVWWVSAPGGGGTFPGNCGDGLEEVVAVEEVAAERLTVLDNFVVLEGLDGAGTTTQLCLLDERLEAEGIPHFCTGEPTGGTIGRLIRDILKRRVRVEPQTVALLFAADRSEHLHAPREGILARVQRGELVISDRYLFSSLAYQSLGCSFEYVRELNRPFPLPRLALFVDTPVAESQQRLARREVAPAPAGEPAPPRQAAAAKELFDGAEIQDEILAAYDRAFATFDGSPMKVHRVDGNEDSRRVFENVWTIIRSLPILRG